MGFRVRPIHRCDMAGLIESLPPKKSDTRGKIAKYTRALYLGRKSSNNFVIMPLRFDDVSRAIFSTRRETFTLLL